MKDPAPRRAIRINVDECIQCPFVLNVEEEHVWMCRPPPEVGEVRVLSYEGPDSFVGTPPETCPIRGVIVLIGGPRPDATDYVATLPQPGETNGKTGD